MEMLQKVRYVQRNSYHLCPRRRLTRDSGTTFRYRSDAVCMNTPSAYRELYGGNKPNALKGEPYNIWRPHTHAHSTWNTTDMAIHKAKRPALNNAFSEKAVKSMEPFITQHVDRWLDILLSRQTPDKASWTPPQNMTHEVNYLILDILTDLCFGESFHIKEDNNTKYRFVPKLLIEYTDFMDPCTKAPFAPLWIFLKPWGLDALFEHLKPAALITWSAFVSSCLEKRTALQRAFQDGTAATPAREDIFHHIFTGQDPDLQASMARSSDLHMECELMLIAGSDTTSTALAAAFFYLSRYPGVQRRLAEEVRGAFASRGDIVSGAALNACVFLRGVVHEVLRMCPPVPAELVREVQPRGVVLDGEVLPPGVKVATAAYCLSYNEDVYPDPFTFAPERWIADDGTQASEERVARAESAFSAFSTGVRGCVGRNLAMLEVQLVLAKVAFEMEIRTGELNDLGAGGKSLGYGRECEKQYQVKECFVCNRDGPLVQLRARTA